MSRRVGGNMHAIFEPIVNAKGFHFPSFKLPLFLLFISIQLCNLFSNLKCNVSIINIVWLGYLILQMNTNIECNE